MSRWGLPSVVNSTFNAQGGWGHRRIARRPQGLSLWLTLVASLLLLLTWPIVDGGEGVTTAQVPFPWASQPVLAATDASVKVVVNGQLVTTDEAPRIVNGRTLVPIRVISETLGVEVAWDGPTQTVALDKDGQQITLTVGSHTARIDGREVALEAAPILVAENTAGRTMVPLRFVGEALGAVVGWDGETRTASVNLGGTITGLKYQRLSAGEVPTIELSGAVMPRSFRLDNPHRLVLDFPHTSLAADLSPSLPGAGDLVMGFRVGEPEEDTARVVIDLTRAVDYELLTGQDGTVYVLLDHLARRDLTESDLRASLQPVVLPQPQEPQVPTAPEAVLAQVDWSRHVDTYLLHFHLSDLTTSRITAQGSTSEQALTVSLPGVIWDGPGETWTLEDLGPLQSLAVKPFSTGQPGVHVVVNWDQPLEYQVLPVTGGGRLTIELAQRLPRPNIMLPGDEEPPTDEGHGPPTAHGSLTALRHRLIVVDPGHGGRDPGSTSGQVYESRLNWPTAVELKDILEAAGARVIMTRNGDETVDLYRRAELANEVGAEAYVAIHFNASERQDIAGTETYYHPHSEISGPLAAMVHEHLLAQLGRPDRGVRTANFVVLRETVMPAILVEALYLSNADDDALAVKPETHRRIAAGIAAGLNDFFHANP